MTQRLADDIRQLAKTNPPLDDKKMRRHLGNLERIAGFYEQKAEAEGVPEKQADMFRSFFKVVVYAISVIKMHRKLAIRLAEMAEEAEE